MIKFDEPEPMPQEDNKEEAVTVDIKEGVVKIGWTENDISGDNDK